MKKILSILLAAILFFTYSVYVFAAGENTSDVNINIIDNTKLVQTIADKNELPAGVPILCWKFYGRQGVEKVAVIFTFNSNKNRAVIPLENMSNNTTAKKSVEINGMKYKIEHDAKNKKVLVLD